LRLLGYKPRTVPFVGTLLRRLNQSSEYNQCFVPRQHDLRTSHRCTSANVLVNLLNHLGRYAEAKCVSVNPRRPYQLAVGANDLYVRLYDTRMIKLSKMQVRLN
jgi:hypothetical protein